MFNKNHQLLLAALLIIRYPDKYSQIIKSVNFKFDEIAHIQSLVVFLKEHNKILKSELSIKIINHSRAKTKISIVNSRTLTVMWLAIATWLFLEKYWSFSFYWLAIGGLATISSNYIKNDSFTLNKSLDKNFSNKTITEVLEYFFSNNQQAINLLSNINQEKNKVFLENFFDMFNRISIPIHSYLTGNSNLKVTSDMLYEFFIIDNKFLLTELLSTINLLKQKKLIPVNSVINNTNITGYNLLQIALAKKRWDIAEMLLENGANPNCITSDGYSLLHDVSILKNNDAIKLLLHFKIKREAKDGNGVTPFFSAITSNLLAAATILANHGANVDCIDNEGFTPLLYCLSSYKVAIDNKNYNLAEKELTKIQLLCKLKANFNKCILYKNLKIKSKQKDFNYFFYIFSQKLITNQFEPIDLKLMQIFAQAGFNFEKQKDDQNNSLKAVLLHSQDMGVMYACGLLQEGQYLSEVQIKVDDQICLIFEITAKLLTDDEKAILKNTLDKIIDSLSEPEVLLNNETIYPSLTFPLNESEAAYKLKIIESITSQINDIKNTLIHLGLNHVPKWIEHLSEHQTLASRSLVCLEDTLNTLKLWKEKTEYRLNKLNQIKSNQKLIKKTTSSFFQLVTFNNQIESNIPNVLYEGTLPFNEQIMIKIKGSLNFYLLLPFNAQENVGLEVISNFKAIDADDLLKFLAVINDPVLSNDPNKPGIKFFSSNYYCNAEINGIICSRKIVAELKIANSPHRIALYCLTKQGQGPMIMALGPFIPHGLHDNRYGKNLGKAHAMSLTKETMEDILNKIAAYTTETRKIKPC